MQMTFVYYVNCIDVSWSLQWFVVAGGFFHINDDGKISPVHKTNSISNFRITYSLTFWIFEYKSFNEVFYLYIYQTTKQMLILTYERGNVINLF